MVSPALRDCYEACSHSCRYGDHYLGLSSYEKPVPFSGRTVENVAALLNNSLNTACRYTVEPKMESRGDTSDGTACETVVEIEDVCRFGMRAAMQFVDTCNLFPSSITARRGINSAGGKSIMQMSILAATCGSKFRIRAEGVEAQETITAPAGYNREDSMR